MAVSAHDVARELRRLLPDAGVVKIHKLLYYCQGWCLAWTNEPMFEESIEAWENGPVVADLWRAEDRGDAPTRPRALTNDMLVVVQYVASKYGKLSGRDLIELTHSETPWQLASERGLNTTIDLNWLAAYFDADEDQRDIRAAYQLFAHSPKLIEAVKASTSPARGPLADDGEDLREMLLKL